MGRNDITAVGKGCIRACQTEGRNLKHAQRQGRFCTQLLRYAQPPGRFNNAVASDLLAQPHRNAVDRQRESFFEGDLAAIVSAVVLRLPSVDRNGSVQPLAVCRESRLYRGKIDHRLERRSRLPVRLGRTVETAFPVIPSSDHREYLAVDIHGDKRDLDVLVAQRLVCESRGNDVFGVVLQFRIEGRACDDVSVQSAEIVGDARREPVDRIADVARSRQHGYRNARSRIACGFGVNVALVRHRAQDQLGAFQRGVRIMAWRMTCRRFQQSCEQCRFAQGQRFGGFAEILPRRGVYSVRARAEINAIEIEREYLFFGEAAFQPYGQQRFANLSND